MSLVDREDVPEEKSSLSTRPTRSPLVAASRATPHPVAPPPITRMSRGLTGLEPIRADSCTALDGTTAKGSPILLRIESKAGGPPPRSLAETEGSRSVRYPPPVATANVTAVAPSRRSRMEVAMAVGDGR